LPSHHALCAHCPAQATERLFISSLDFPILGNAEGKPETWLSNTSNLKRTTLLLSLVSVEKRLLHFRLSPSSDSCGGFLDEAKTQDSRPKPKEIPHE
jgi:hypothetical protein